MDNGKRILSLDVSTACIGASIIDYDGKLEWITHIVPKIAKNVKGIEALCLKKIIFETEFLSKCVGLKLTDVCIEEPLISSNNSQTCATLLRFNGMISDSIYRVLGIVPEYISSMEARKYAFPQLLAIRHINKKGEKHPFRKIMSDIENEHLVMYGNYNWDIDKKVLLKGFIDDIYPDIEWLYNKKGELIKENYDMSDALVAALAYRNKIIYGEMTPKIINHTHDCDKKIINYQTQIWDKKYDKIIKY